jgi:cysteinyl-tRNA synthetase
MMEIKIFNTLTRKEEILTPIDQNHLQMYVCGPTVYDRPHLGNARSAVVYDMFFRFFQKIYQKVTFVRNITDVDDKINAAATSQAIPIQELTDKITKLFHQDLDALNVLRPTLEPKATQNIPEMIAMIEKLIENGNAYESKGHVLFDVNSYENYGELSRRTLDEMVAGARVEVASYKKNPLDFVLWKPASANDDVSSVFESPWSKGRPGWHIECSAMSVKYLGQNFDIHGGGADLQFPHHENEIAQSKCALRGSNYAKYWIHNGFLTVNGEKMSKSLKNFITVRDLLDKGENGLAIRYLLLAAHYRKPLDFSQKTLDDAKKSIAKFYAIFDESDLKKPIKQENGALMVQILQFLADDLNMSKVFALLHEKNKNKDEMLQALDFLGLLDVNYFAAKKGDIDENFIISQIEARKQAKKDKNFALSDQIRADLSEKGVIIEDRPNGEVIWKYA